MKYVYDVQFARRVVRVIAKSVGNAYRKAFRNAIRLKHEKRQPRTDHETGGFEGVTVRLVRRAAA